MNVLITGAAGGLGRAMAIECAKRKYNLFLTDINKTGLMQIKIGLKRQYDITVAIKDCDLSNRKSVDKLFAFIDHHNIHFDMLLNIAGIDFEGSFQNRERDKITKIIEVNNRAALLITHDILKRRKSNGHFYAVFVSSLASMFPMPLKATYAASKRFLYDFALALRQELKQENANILSLCPGGLITNEEAKAAIDAQGFWGDITTNHLEKVARKTLDRVLSGKDKYIPGGFNRFLAILGKIIPRRIIAYCVYSRWNCAQRKWLQD